MAIYWNIAVLSVLACIIQQTDSSLTLVTTENYDATIVSGKWMVMFFAPWCPACQGIDPVWAKFSKHNILKEKEISIAQVNVSAEPAISGQYLIFNLPTIYFLKDGVAWPFTKLRNYDTFVNWVENESWKQETPLEWWRAPNSYNMKMVGRFFQFANIMRGYHQQLIDDFGLPFWVAYAVFAMITIFIGITLGMLFVWVCDTLFPPKAQQIKYKKPPKPQPIQELDEHEHQSDDNEHKSDDGYENENQSEHGHEDQSENSTHPEEENESTTNTPSKVETEISAAGEAQANMRSDAGEAQASTRSDAGEGKTVRQRKSGKAPKKI